MSRRPRRRTISAAALRRADRRREEARINAALRRHAWEEYRWATSGFDSMGIAIPGVIPLSVFFIDSPDDTPGALETTILPLLSKGAASLFRSVRLCAYRARAGVERSFARECAQRLRDARDSGRIEYLRVLRALAAERVRREDAREREALTLSDQPAAAKRRAAARAKRDLAWQDWFGTLEKAVAGSGTPPREPGMPRLPDRPRRKGAPIRRLCAFSAKAAPTGDEVREQFERARGRGKVEEKIRLGSMLLDAEATTDSSLIRDGDGEIRSSGATAACAAGSSRTARSFSRTTRRSRATAGSRGRRATRRASSTRCRRSCCSRPIRKSRGRYGRPSANGCPARGSDCERYSPRRRARPWRGSCDDCARSGTNGRNASAGERDGWRKRTKRSVKRATRTAGKR